jgi:hypothetical protein
MTIPDAANDHTCWLTFADKSPLLLVADGI